ncbi:hypothetical protein GCM10007857_09300 [Bradyrhizobium iriomotense]|uniref:Uncharacterized protein n=1 Tax=Bradyrhizobium iriomotense TaxID=441950 RepID=A0ABQ6AUC5_9BRAD|nr:hypothetical protein GCM10007857_09300 [Bradyrhizobium iriomotense]
MKGAVGISRPRRGPPSGERSNTASPPYLPVEYAPLRRKGLRAVRSPSFTARSFPVVRISRSACMRLPTAPC